MLKLTKIKKSFGKNEVLKGVSLEAKRGEVIAILGPSGSGKTTLIRCINFLESADEGIVEVNGKIIDTSVRNRRRDVLELRRQTAMVFQNYNLFRNKTVLENVVEALITVKNTPKEEAHTTAKEALKKVNLTDKNNEYPSRLSGGQQQRVGIARALALNPHVILLDEPTSSLDPELVDEVLSAMTAIAREGITMVVATHEMSFARDVANKVIFIDGGAIVEEGTPDQLFMHPKEERTKQFLNRTMREWIYNI
ncbi:MAG: amino acid ABC transporter ATP-binding protein [Synergistaceae bacterium]|jgi:L-cystine transport system ATP-binding protein|nr:amino acid ABC transporter ATP-binding protein [Synergistaceae bacterium]